MGDDTLCMKSIVRIPLKSSVTLCLLSQKRISPDTFDLNAKKHGVWKSQKMSHFTLKTKQATFTF